MKYHIKNKRHEPVGIATSMAQAVALCGVYYEHKRVESPNKIHPSYMHLTAYKDGALWYEHDYPLQVEGTVWHDKAHTYHEAVKQALADIYRKCKQEFIITESQWR